ncbi:CBASS oligonucleotide cyclase [Methanoregula sp. UBA64]|jgi:hypothetical protein|uniref:CBASS oligonucleotide cyclase n=1 Tax=Methanoregula sp. UBA64 TaxID=1915554 RepID=UPI00260024C7|nr:CBASS oligonucleotide cyclase [Methanoregula sp. UBA64]
MGGDIAPKEYVEKHGPQDGQATIEQFQDLLTRKRIQDKSESYETDINEKINEKLSVYNDRDTEIHREHLKDIRKIIEDDNEGSIELKFAGSVSKHTYIDGLSDVDVLVLVNNSELADKSPQEIKIYLKSVLQKRLKHVKEIHTGSLAITVIFSDGTEIQLLPALKRGEGYRIQEEKRNSWSNVTRPDKFAAKLTETNQNCGQKVIPVIKIAKSINSQLPEDQQLSGYHIESLAIKIFRGYPEDAPRTPKFMLKYFFEKATVEVKTQIKDSTHQSIHVDDYLGPNDSLQRKNVSDTLKRISDRMKNADSNANIEEWEKILGDINE